MIIEAKSKVYCDMCTLPIDMGNNIESIKDWENYKVPVIIHPIFHKFVNGSITNRSGEEIVLCKDCALRVENFINSFTLKNPEKHIKTFSIGTINTNTINGGSC